MSEVIVYGAIECVTKSASAPEQRSNYLPPTEQPETHSLSAECLNSKTRSKPYHTGRALIILPTRSSEDVMRSCDSIHCKRRLPRTVTNESLVEVLEGSFYSKYLSNACVQTGLHQTDSARAKLYSFRHHVMHSREAGKEIQMWLPSVTGSTWGQ